MREHAQHSAQQAGGVSQTSVLALQKAAGLGKEEEGGAMRREKRSGVRMKNPRIRWGGASGAHHYGRGVRSAAATNRNTPPAGWWAAPSQPRRLAGLAPSAR